MKERTLIWILVALTLIHFAAAATCEATGSGKCYYVSNKAGSGAGTYANPYGMADLPANNLAQCQLSSVAIQPLQPGDILYFMGGAYQFSACTSSDYYDTGYIRPARSGSQGSPITFKAYPGDTVTFNIVGNQGILGNSGFSDIKFEGFILNSNNHGEGAIEIINGNRIEVNRMQVIGSYVATSDNHDGIRIEQASNVWVHNSIIQGVTGDSENSAGIKLYVDTGTIVEDNYIHDNTAGVYDKDSGKNNTYRRNFFTRNSNSEFLGNNQGTPGLFYIYDNVLDGEVNLYQLNSGSQINDNLIRGNTLAGGYAGKQYNLNLWNNIVISKSSSITAYYDDGDSYVQSGSSASLAYMDYNLYDAATQYRFGTYAGSASTFTQQDMKTKGFEQNSQVQPSSSIFADEVSYNILPQWKTAGRYADQIGPDNVSLVLDTTRYGPGAISSNVTQPPPDTTPPTTPTGLIANAISSSAINLVWNASSDNVGVTGYRVYRCQGAICTPSTQVGTPTTNSYQDTGLTSGTTYTYTVAAYDAAQNPSATSTSAQATTQAAADTTPPVISNGQPTGTLSAGTPSTTISVTTNEAATCRYSTTAGTTYASMTSTFTTTGGTTHSKAINGLANNSTYHYYVRCNDTSGNTNTQDYPITFSVAAQTTTTGQGDLNADGKVDFLDLVIVINDFRHSGAAIQNTKADINGDGTVNLFDFVLLTKNWGRVYSSTDVTPPTITLTSPVANSKVSGTITVSATASDNVGVAGVQFMVDGSNFGTEDTATPYSTSLVTNTLTNAVHTVSARARDTSSNTATASVSVTVNNSGGTSGTLYGLDFPGVGGVTRTMSFSFSSPISYPATYIWRVYPKQQSLYYTAFFYGNSGAFQGNNDYYGFHPYPNWAQSGTHLWEIASPPGGDWTGAAVVYNQWYQQAAVVYKSGSQTYNIFYWNWPDTTKNITHIDTTARSPPSSPAITVADAPWNQGNEEWYGYMRGFQFYDAVLTPSQISQEIASPGSVRMPWYLNINPTPSDISDKSGNNHNPAWIGSERPGLWTG